MKTKTEINQLDHTNNAGGIFCPHLGKLGCKKALLGVTVTTALLGAG